MSIGYACLAVGVPYTDQKSCILKNVSQAKLEQWDEGFYAPRAVYSIELPK